MYETLTPESIKEEVLSEISNDIAVGEGTYTNNVLSPLAYALWKFYQTLDATLPIAFVDETSGEYIDKRASEYGIVRKAGTKAKASLLLTGTADTLIPKGTVFATQDGLEFETLFDVSVGSDGTVQTDAEASDVGTRYNVGADKITQQLQSISGLTSVTNRQAVTGGTEVESDEALLERLFAFLRMPATSGNVYHYKRWALEVNGVGDAKVLPLWNGAGTVKVLIVDAEKAPAGDDIVSACDTHIKSQCPIGATVTVQSAEALTVNVSAKVTLDGSVTLEQLQTAFHDALSAYVKSIAFTSDMLFYNRISYLLLDMKGVVDFASLTVNGGTANIPIGQKQVPVLGNVEVT